VDKFCVRTLLDAVWKSDAVHSLELATSSPEGVVTASLR
jgi:hypothetical protein